ncbi:unnamed protein product [Ceratitis capitata]|uniref:(Mediterranean fruit fly) hypothetical protein n=1 Tax=Ceratitis capitata TaxID=7213 RepID=A0A811V3B6_CERCA|nr:unnamed protein product [Ceratitis capitata]
MKSQILALLQQQQGFSTLLRLMYRMANIDKQLQLTAAKVDAMRSEIIVEWHLSIHIYVYSLQGTHKYLENILNFVQCENSLVECHSAFIPRNVE